MIAKKLTLAAAVAASFAVPAYAQSSVQLYGKLYPHVIQESRSGGTAVGTPVATVAGAITAPSDALGYGLFAANSRLGFKGTEDLGGGWKAFFQLEGVASVDDGTGNGHGNFQFNRNTFVALGGPFGMIKLGNNDTIFKEYGDTLGVLGLSSGSFMSSSGVLRKPGFGTSSSSSFHLRRANSIIYETPEIANFQAGVQYSTDEVLKQPGTSRNPRLSSFGVKYDNGPIYVAVAHEIHWDFFGGSRNVPSAMRNNADTDPTHSKDYATEFIVEYRLGKDHKIEFDAIRKTYTENATVAGRFQRYSNMAYMLNAESRWTEQWRTGLSVVRSKAGNCSRIATACTTDGLEGTKYTGAVGYSLSKRTMLFAAASLIKNGRSARYSNVEFNGEPNLGEKIRHVAIGVSHNF